MNNALKFPAAGPRERRRGRAAVAIIGLFLLSGLLLGVPGLKRSATPQASASEADGPAGADKLVLRSGKTIWCTVLDLSADEVVIRSDEGRSVFKREEVSGIERAVPERFEEFFEKHAAKTTTVSGWRKLADFCRNKKAHVEQRKCLREIVALDPGNRQARLELGHALFEDEWLTEEQVAEKIAAGYRLEEGELVPDAALLARLEKEKAAEKEAEKETAPETTVVTEKETRKRPERGRIKAEDHVNKVLEEKDPHSLWLILCRSGIRVAGAGKSLGEVNIDHCRTIIREIDALEGDYATNMKEWMSSVESPEWVIQEPGVPKDWQKENAKKVGDFKKKFRNGIHVETRHYHILSTANREMTNQVARSMDTIFSEVYQGIFEFEEKIPYKYIVRFWNTRDQFIAEGGAPQAAAYFSPGTKELVGYNSRTDFFSMQSPFQNLFHEGWHQFFDFYIPNGARWFDEGFAECISPTTIEKNRARWNGFNNLRSGDVNQALQRGQLIPLMDLFKMGPKDFYGGPNASLAYAQSWSFVYFLIKHPQGKVRNMYRDYFWELREGTDPALAAEHVFKEVKFETLEQAWIQAIPNQKR